MLSLLTVHTIRMLVLESLLYPIQVPVPTNYLQVFNSFIDTKRCTCCFLCVLALTITTTVVLFRVRTYYDYDTRTDGTNRMDWGWHFSAVTSLLALITLIVFNYATRRLSNVK